METLLCVNAHFALFWLIVHMAPFLKSGLRVAENAENAVLAFSCGRRICILCTSMTPSPHPSTCSLRPLNPTTSRKNNNNGGLHSCVHPAEDIEPVRVTRAKYSAPLPRCWAKKRIMDNRLAIFLLLLLSVCIQRAGFMCMLCLFFSIFSGFQVPPIGLEYELKRVESFTVDPWMKIFLEWCQVNRGGKDCFGTCGHGLKPCLCVAKIVIFQYDSDYYNKLEIPVLGQLYHVLTKITLFPKTQANADSICRLILAGCRWASIEVAVPLHSLFSREIDQLIFLCKVSSQYIVISLQGKLWIGCTSTPDIQQVRLENV